MIKIPTAFELEALAKLAGTNITQVCIEAGVRQPAFSRWKHGHGQLTAIQLQRLADVLNAKTQDAA